MGSFFAEMKRRHMYRVAAAYAVVAWLLLQLVNNLAPAFDLPPWITRAVVLILIIGLPVVLIFAWVQQLAPEPASATPGKFAAGKLDWFLAGAVVLTLGLSVYQLTGSQGSGTTQQQAGVETARRAAASPATAISIAVLPFENLSGDATQEFFSDGMTEEITAALAKVPDLKVVARTSAFQFKTQNRDIQSIGQQLHATHFIEGSVRKAGNRVRITAQLINASDGTHVWTDNYDRELTDIFVIQEEIARAIATSLRMPLGLKAGENLVNNRKIDPDTYQLYLRAKARYRAGAIRGYTDARMLLEQVVARDPDYAPAWALLGAAYETAADFAARAPSFDEAKRNVDPFAAKAVAAVKRAVQLDANLAEAYATQSWIESIAGNFIAAEDFSLKALALDGGNPDILHGYSILLAQVGRLKEAMAIRLQLQSVEPFVPTYNAVTAKFLWLTGQNDAALAAFNAQTTLAGLRAQGLARAYATSGRFKEAADSLAGPAAPTPGFEREAASILRSAPAKLNSTGPLPDLLRSDWVYLYVGAPEEAIRWQERLRELNRFMDERDGGVFIWHPDSAPLRKTDRFKRFVRKAGLVDYWRARGWPEACHPTTADDFECD